MSTNPKLNLNELVDKCLSTLKKIARQQKSKQYHNTLQTTEIIHETYLRVIQMKQKKWPNEQEFLIHMASSIKQFLIDQHRKKMTQKRGTGLAPTQIQEDMIEYASPDGFSDWLSLDYSLKALKKHDSQAADLAMYKYFLGLSLAEISKIMQLSPRSVSRKWSYARSWLHLYNN